MFSLQGLLILLFRLKEKPQGRRRGGDARQLGSQKTTGVRKRKETEISGASLQDPPGRDAPLLSAHQHSLTASLAPPLSLPGNSPHRGALDQRKPLQCSTSYRFGNQRSSCRPAGELGSRWNHGTGDWWNYASWRCWPSVTSVSPAGFLAFPPYPIPTLFPASQGPNSRA